jgi:hypothetical protein
MKINNLAVICPPNFKLSEWLRLRASWAKLPPPPKPEPPTHEELLLASFHTGLTTYQKFAAGTSKPPRELDL